MIQQNAVESVVAVLSEAGYQLRKAPLTIQSMTFDFPTSLIGPDGLRDLVIVADTAIEGEERLAEKLEALGRALDSSESSRPLTTIFVGPRPGADTLDAVTRYSRALFVDAGSAESEKLEDRLAVLLPLEVIEVSPERVDVRGKLKEAIGKTASGKTAARLLEAGTRGARHVEAEFSAILVDSLNTVVERAT